MLNISSLNKTRTSVIGSFIQFYFLDNPSKMLVMPLHTQITDFQKGIFEKNLAYSAPVNNQICAFLL